MGEHAYGRTVDNDVMVVENVLCEVGISKHAWMGRSADIFPCYTHGVQTVADGLAGASRAQDKRFSVVRLDKRAYAIGKANGVAVETFESDAL